MSAEESAASVGRRRVYLMRHAEVRYFDEEGRPLDPRAVPLTARGRNQAAAAGALIAPVELDRVLCSGMPRTRETAELVVRGRGLEVEDAPAFREIRAGRLRDQAPEAIASPYDAAHAPGALFLGGEGFAGFAARVLSAWRDLAADRSWRRALLVAHDAVNRVVLAEVCGAGLAGLRSFEQDPGCINVIDLGADGAILRAANLTPYDGAKAGLWHTSMERVRLAYRNDIPLGGQEAR